jgi:hypothetical protein
MRLPLGNLWVSMLNRMGVKDEKVGDSNSDLGYLASRIAALTTVRWKGMPDPTVPAAQDLLTADPSSFPSHGEMRLRRFEDRMRRRSI